MNQILALLTTLLVYGFLHYLAKKHVNFGYRTIIALAFGLGIGFIFQGATEYIIPFGRVFTRLIGAIVVPILFFSILSSVASLDNIARLKSMGLRSVFWLLLNTLIASTLTLVTPKWIGLGKGFSLQLPNDYVAREVPSIIDTLIEFFPNNIIAHASNNQVIPIIIFSLLLGVALIKLNSKDRAIAQPIIRMVESLNKLTYELVKMIIRLTPYAVVAFIANVPTRDGGKDLKSFVVVIIFAYVLSFFQAFVVQGTLVKLFAKMSPKKFFKAIWPAQVVAFTTQSSIGTVPVVIEQLHGELGGEKDVASFVAGLGANMGMPACTGIWPIILAVFSINALNIPFSTTQYILLVVYTIVISFGTAGVPGTATIAATAVLSAANLPLEIIFVLAPISSLVDMARTMSNVTGSASAAVVVAYQEDAIREI